jgi:phage minor structural protein
MIYVLNKSEEICDCLEPNKKRAYWNDLHIQDLKEGIETLEFDSNVEIPTNSTVVLKTPNNELIPFIVQQVVKSSSDTLRHTYYCDCEFLELRYSKVLEPQEIEGQTSLSALSFGLQGTRWIIGDVEESDVQKVVIDEYMNALKYLRTISELFDLELRFRVEFGSHRVTKRIVDFKKKTGLDAGKEIVFSKDLKSIERQEDSSPVVTALYGIGPADSEGNYMSIESVNSGKKYIENLDALQRWGKDGEHRFDIFTPSVAYEDLTPQVLFALTQKELNRRVAAHIQYKVDAVDLFEVIGKKHEAVFLGDTVRIKDEKFNPALYLEARVIRIERSYSDPSVNQFMLGEYREINPKTYKYIRDIQKVLNGNKETWNSVKTVKNNLDEQITKSFEIEADVDGLQVTYQELKDSSDTQSQKIAQIEVDASEINSRVSDMQINVDGLDSRVVTNESEISQQASLISNKVSYTDYNGDTIVSKINQDAFSYKVTAQMIEMEGITTVNGDLRLGETYRDNKSLIFNGSTYLSSSGSGFEIASEGYIMLDGAALYRKKYGVNYPIVESRLSHQEIQLEVTSTGGLRVYVNGKVATFSPTSWT